MPIKSPLKSKTMWVNMLIIGAGVLSFVAGHDLVVDNATVVSILTIAVGVVNVALRFVTNAPVK